MDNLEKTSISDEERLLSVRAVADCLSLSRSQVRNLVRHGYLTAYRIGVGHRKKLLIPLLSIESLLEKSQYTPKEINFGSKPDEIVDRAEVKAALGRSQRCLEKQTKPTIIKGRSVHEKSKSTGK
jgi:excisionase family DNA binding protein